MNQSTYSNVIVAKVLERRPHHKAEFTTLLLEAIEYVRDAKAIALGKQGKPRKRTVYHPFHNSVIEKLDLKVGDNLVEKYKANPEFAKEFENGGRISVEEIIESDYNDLPDNKRKEWCPKSIPANGDEPAKPLYDNASGERIYHCRRFVAYGDKHWDDVSLKCHSKEALERKNINKLQA